MLQRLLKVFQNDRSGVAAIEFALIAPFLALLLVGGVNYFALVRTQNAVSSAADVVAELIAHDDIVTDLDINNAFEVSRVMLKKFDRNFDTQTSAVLRIANVEEISRGNYSIAWQRTSNMPEFNIADIKEMELPPLQVYGSVIVVEVAANYEPMLTNTAFSAAEIKKTSFRMPVNVDFINSDFKGNKPGSNKPGSNKPGNNKSK